jgi:hypothetical protein
MQVKEQKPYRPAHYARNQSPSLSNLGRLKHAYKIPRAARAHAGCARPASAGTAYTSISLNLRSHRTAHPVYTAHLKKGSACTHLAH